jgi:hypothetical protein
VSARLAWFTGRPPLVQLAILLAIVLVAYYLTTALLALVPLLFAAAHGPRVLHGRHRLRRSLVVEALAAGGGFLLGRHGRRPSQPGRPIKVRGETYQSPDACRRAARELFAQASNVPNETGRWRELIDHAIELERAAWEAETR